jgi:hypothetical protein
MNQHPSTGGDDRSSKIMAAAGTGLVLGTASGLVFNGLFAMPGISMIAGTIIGLLVGAAIGSRK